MVLHKYCTYLKQTTSDMTVREGLLSSLGTPFFIPVPLKNSLIQSNDKCHHQYGIQCYNQLKASVSDMYSALAVYKNAHQIMFYTQLEAGITEYITLQRQTTTEIACNLTKCLHSNLLYLKMFSGSLRQHCTDNSSMNVPQVFKIQCQHRKQESFCANIMVSISYESFNS